jgi:diacylglycerol kinase (ATP)
MMCALRVGWTCAGSWQFRMTERPASHDGLTGIARIWRAIRILLRTLVWSFRREEALRLEILALLVLGPLGYYLGQSPVERVLLIGAVVLLLIVELLNTAIEVTVDRIGTEHHELSGLAKDLGSVAVGITLLLGIAVWLIILI